MANSKQQKTVVNNKGKAPALAEASRSRKPLIIIISALAALAVVGGIILGVFLANRDKSIDFWNDNLGRYIKISEEQYKNYQLPEIPLEKVSAEGLQRKINKLLVSNKNKEALYEGAYVTNLPMTLGDVAYIWYRGYTVDENGVETDFAGGTNFSSESATALELGSGSFVPGFEEALIGVVPNQHSSFSKISVGSIQPGDVIYLTALVYNPDGTYKNLNSERIDLSDKDAVDAKYGTGFTEFFIGKTTETGTNAPQKIGESLSSKVFYVGTSSMATAYYDMKVDFATRCETDPVTIDVRFPADDSQKTLRGVEAKFDVYVSYAKIYDTPEFDDKFVTETLKIKAEDLEGYTGSASEKYTELLRSEYKAEVTETNRVLLEEEMWKYYKSVVTVKKLPEASVKEFYNSYYSEIENYYASYTSYYETIDAFAIAYLGLSADSDWRNYLIDKAKDIVIEKLLFYYIIAEEKIAPPEDYYNEKYAELYQEYLDYYIELNADELSKYEGEEYDREIELLKKELDSYYGEQYFKESIYYDYATKIMLEYSLGEGYFD